MKNERVYLAGASGSMGFEAFKNLWKKRDRYDIVLLQRPSKKNKKLFRRYEKASGIKSIPGRGVVGSSPLKIVWGDATNFNDVSEACKGIDWCLCPMAFISPAADLNPKMAEAVNTTAVKYIIRAIEAQPNGKEHIKLIYIGTVAETGDRLKTIHVGRIGDPLKPSIFDFYAVTKIAGERAVLESNIKHWASLRQTYIMTHDNVEDPIMFHQPIDSFMENNTKEDAGRGLINCLEIPDDSDFWRRIYNMAGGPSCRTTFYEMMKRIFAINGLRLEKVTKRKWFALRNFHMQYFEDSKILNAYIHNWGDSLEDYYESFAKNRPIHLKIISSLCKQFSVIRNVVEKVTYKRFEKLASESKNGTVYWYKNQNDMRISAFYKDYETYEAIPDWGIDIPEIVSEKIDWHRLDHGYDESKKVLELDDLKIAAKFRGGVCLSTEWNGDMYLTLKWQCAVGHEFNAKPYTILKAGHWCPKCLPPPWNYDEVAKHNPFFAQVWYPNHDRDESNFYPEDCYQDIVE
ncbi:MAG: NAD-dependent epimerase/dehydratase family protein [Candidatus Hodarchaeota archaeon]